MSGWKFNLSEKDVKQMGALAIPLFLILVIETMFEDWFRTIEPHEQFLILFGLIISVAWVYQSLLRNWAK